MKKIIVLLILALTLSAQTIDNYKIIQAGEDLKSSRIFFYLGLGINIIGSYLILTAKSSAEQSDGSYWTDPKIPIGWSINFTGIVCHLFSWHFIGKAGEKLATAEKH